MGSEDGQVAHQLDMWIGAKQEDMPVFTGACDVTVRAKTGWQVSGADSRWMFQQKDSRKEGEAQGRGELQDWGAPWPE